MKYDNLGRRTVINNPDTGKVEIIYDLASNVIQKITPNLRAGGKKILYGYEFNRLSSITYPDFLENNVSYEYGGPSELGKPGNLVGRITRVNDESGTEERFYDKLGAIAKEVKTVELGKPHTFTTEFIYDTWGRLQELAYSDGEKLTYSYDSGGLVRAIEGQKDSVRSDYVLRLEYDKFEQRVFVKNGNGTKSTYSYDPRDRRLANLRTRSQNDPIFQNLIYAYDEVGNIVGLRNEAPVVSGRIGGPVERSVSSPAPSPQFSCLTPLLELPRALPGPFLWV